MSKLPDCLDIQSYLCLIKNSPQLKQIGSNEEKSTFDSARDEKLFKNKISAQNSRIRKKNYIQDLQRNQQELIKQIEQTQMQINKTNQQLNDFLPKNRQNDNFNPDQKLTHEKLKQLIRSQYPFDQDEANLIIDLLINRNGVTGKQRRRMIDYYSKRLINFSIPAIYRYLLHASNQSSGLLSKNSKAMYDWDQQLYQKLVLEQKQKTSLIEIRCKVFKLKRKWMMKIKEFQQMKQQIYKTSFGIETDLLAIKSSLSTKQVGEIILGIQSFKYQRKLNLIENLEHNEPIKKVKIQKKY